jgi:hypothetical protein
MSKSNQSDWNHLLSRAFDEGLEGDDLKRLEQIMSEDPSAMDEYVQHAILQSYLEQEHQEEKLKELVLDSIRGETESPAPEGCAVDKDETQPASTLIRRIMPCRRTWGTAAVIVVSACLVIAVIDRFTSQPSVDNGGATPNGGVNVSADYAAKVIGISQCRWLEPRRELRRGDMLQPGQTVHLAEGVARFRFRSGTEIAVEGPAEFALIDDNAMLLYNGQLMAHVFENGVGFTVHTPDAEVIDLGTRFGISVDKNGATEAHVFEGEIEMNTRGEMIETFAGSAVRVEAGHFEVKEASPEQFQNLAESDHIEIVIDLPRVLRRPPDNFQTTPITWSEPKNLTAAEDIITEGSLVRAVNCGWEGLSLNGVEFGTGSPLEGRGGTSLEDRSSGDPELDKLISTYAYAKIPYTTYIEGLEPGQRYQLQLILADPRTERDGDHNIYGDGCVPANKATLRNQATEPGEPPFGQYVIGSFTANDFAICLTLETAGLRFGRPVPRDVAFISGYVLREVEATPETP